MTEKSAEQILTKRMKVYGIVQGVGFRPSVARHASEAKVTGYVCNKGPYVEVIAQGTEQSIREFAHLLQHRPPRRAVILKIDSSDWDDRKKYDEFTIAVSERTSGEIFIPPDIATCEDCERELFDPGDRRYLHPFINCTSCGPRLTILDALPYDRERTSMKMFPMCRICSREYHDPASRRYDAQPVCCNDCGPQVRLLPKSAAEGGQTGKELTGLAAIGEAKRVIREGGIVAVKGIGGFHLCCDAGNEQAVQLLRDRKRRPRKPFAVMMRDADTVRACCEVTQEQEEILTGHQKPILLLPRRESGEGERILCGGIAPGNPTVGVMLPYAPVHMLLFSDINMGGGGMEESTGGRMPPALVMTSGNISGAPICREDSEALSQLGSFCDCILTHDRRIRIRADDSVMDFYDGEPYMIRRSRGYAPLPYMLSEFENSVPVLAVGGELKNTFCIGRGALFYPSSYIGDLADPRSTEVLRETVDRYSSLLEVIPEAVACDLHPGYHSTEFALEWAQKLSEVLGREVPLIRVQHHYAHIVSCMAENDFTDRVIGVSMDGTGYGTDGSIWGGEILLADCHGFDRAGSIKPFAQVGGDAASRDGWRIAVSMLRGLYSRQNTEGRGLTDRVLADAERLGLCSRKEAAAVNAMVEYGLNKVTSTSTGRLFDAVSCILGICRTSSFEGEASMDLEFAAERYERSLPGGEEPALPESFKGADMSPRREEGRWIMPTDEIVALLTEAMLEHTGQGSAQRAADHLAYCFHRLLADAVIACVSRVSSESGIHTAALSGGCYQNKLLLRLTQEGLMERGIRVLRHRLLPPNDGGIALGQAVIAAASLRDNE